MSETETYAALVMLAVNPSVLRSAIDFVALLAGSVYCTIPLFWLVVHPFIGGWRRYGRGAYVFILAIWTACISALLLIAWPFRSSSLYTNWFVWLPAGLLFAIGFSIYAPAFRGFERSQVSGLAELEPSRHRQELVTSGIRGRVRHPIYLGHLCEVLAWCVGTGLIALYVMAAFAIATGALMIRIEDRELEARFGEPYREYRRAVPAVVPHFNRYN